MSKQIDDIFSGIYADYDSMNHLLSMGVDTIWRRAAANEALIEKKSYRVLDIAAGTGEFAIRMAKTARENGRNIQIVGVDYNKGMLSVGKRKIAARGLSNITLEHGDAMSLKYSDSSFDAVTSAFALRDFDSLDRLFKETKRVLKNGGKFVFLDMAMPDDRFGRAFFKQYFKVLKIVGAFVDKNAYDFLFESIMKFDKQNLIRIAKRNGFENVNSHSLLSGVGYYVSGEKRKPARASLSSPARRSPL
ncbi:MAG: ubiquinone/menaquinone biosynthesis methyltransferase [Candidatus Micrarchaeota archaeon]|nr:ubiquinone/menaquinone biosynthesis methyltransferase [Candidatus Micrarchaeota archaeon]MDE1804742.1 ubiquinone/menaquinone biosynthesis methyltransferase [Candidatus Micrarchaeota archaeon]MDE1847009.1 ubiquinone/menaquinone biosynthesis methyltransferase [Candidatus Micrarchaeota archaeon]